MRFSQIGGLLLVLAFTPLHPVQSQSADSALSITPEKVHFGQQALDSESQPITITLANRSPSAIALSEIICSGIDFAAKNGCGNQLAPGAQCAIQVAFRPVIAGERMGVVEILAGDSSNPHFVPLSGNGK